MTMEKETDQSGAFHKGFFDAERRRQVVEDESITSAVARGLFIALPTIGLFYLFSRGRVAASSPKAGGFVSDIVKQFQKTMDPLGSKSFRVEVKDVQFKDVVGIPEALAEVQQYVNFLKTPEKFTRLGGRLPKGCLLTGEPGTGKTLLAKAVAGEAQVPFFTCSGADFMEIFAGSGPKRVRELFQSAKEVSPSVIFIDEIDAVGSRGNKETAGNTSSEENRTVNQILAELDGILAEETVVVFAATNFPEHLDKALLREGRFDRKVELPMPDIVARQDIFEHYLKRVVTGDSKGKLNVGGHRTAANPDVSNQTIAKTLSSLTPGVSPATISAIVNEGALGATLASAPLVRLEHLLPAIDDVLVGKKHRNRMSDSAGRRVALHEAGHTLVAWMLGQQSRVVKVSITPRGQAAGFTQQLGRESLDHTTETKLFTDLCVLLGGRAAESTEFSTLTTGAADDFQRATKNALSQFLAFGMSERLGLLSFDYQRVSEGRMYQLCSEETQRRAEDEASVLVANANAVTVELLSLHKDALRKLSSELFEKKELLDSDIEKILGPRPESSVIHPLVKRSLNL